jgi:Fe-S-cluster containining protein
MKTTTRYLDLLQKIYDLYDAFAADLDPACSEGCATCCTRNVTLTSLEGQLLIQYLNTREPDQWRQSLSAAARLSRFQPKVTINQLADLCMRDDPIPEEEMDPQATPCRLLKDNICTVYAVRPFGCRAMLSSVVCTQKSVAEMPEFVLTVNNVFLQYLEAADHQGISGNLIDVLLYLAEGQHGTIDVRQMVLNRHRHLLANRPISVLMIPPEHRQRMTPLLEKIQMIFKTMDP